MVPPDALTFTPPQLAVLGVEGVLLLLGLGLLWRDWKARYSAEPPPVSPPPAWDASWIDLGLFIWSVMVGGLAGQFAALQGLRLTSLAPETQQILAGAIFQLGMLAGCAMFTRFSPAGRDFPWPVFDRQSVRAGIGAFLLSLPVVLLAGLIWTSSLEACGLPVQRQELVDLFAESKSSLQIGTMVFFAILIAPVTEELVFRAGLYRFLRSRIPRVAALLIPAILFAGLHANLASFAQLVVLGVVFALAYERTGRIAVPMLAHACFNLNTIVLLLAGIDA